MNFYNYMVRNYRNSDTPAGDLAEDMVKESKTFPRNRSCKFEEWHDIICRYLVINHACTECLETFEECWEEYVACEKMKKLERRK